MTEGFIQNVQFDLFEDFTQNIQFDLFSVEIVVGVGDLFSVELVIGETATLLLAENYVTIREVFVDGAKVEPNENKQIFLTSHDIISDDIISTTGVWSSNKTNEEINKLLPLIYAGL